MTKAVKKSNSQLEIPEADPASIPELLKEQQVSKRWNFSLNTLRYWRAVGEGPPFVKIGRLVRYNVAQLVDYVRRHTSEPTTRATAEEVFQRVAH